MGKRFGRILTLGYVIQGLLLSFGSRSEAKNLTRVLEQGFSYNAFEKDTRAAAKAFAPAFSAAVAQAVTWEFPFASVSPAFTYRHNPVTDIYERLTSIPGPIFAERALSLGKGQFNFSVGYSFIDFNKLNGTNLNNIRSPALVGELFDEDAIPVPVDKQPPGLELGSDKLFTAPVTFSQLRTRIDLKAHIIVPTLRYGITDNLDISLSVPIVNSLLRVSNETVQVVTADPNSSKFLFARNANGEITNTFGFFNAAGEEVVPSLVRTALQVKEPLRKAAGSATGVGDITLRTKYQFWEDGLGGSALGINLQLPSGVKEKFHGTGETHVFTFLYVSQVFGKWFEPHLNMGIDFNADDVDRSSFLYAVGGSLLIGENLGILATFFGRSEFKSLSVSVPPKGIYDTGVILDRAPDTCTTTRPCGLLSAEEKFPFFSGKIKRNDIVNFSFGLRYALGVSGSIFFGGIVPLNDDGFRADFIPSGGVEYTF